MRVASFAVFVDHRRAVDLLAGAARRKGRSDDTQFIPYPAWYFLALYGLLRVPGIFISRARSDLANLLATIVFPAFWSRS